MKRVHGYSKWFKQGVNLDAIEDVLLEIADKAGIDRQEAAQTLNAIKLRLEKEFRSQS